MKKNKIFMQIILIAIMIFAISSFAFNKDDEDDVYYSNFIKDVEAGKISEVIITATTIEYELDGKEIELRRVKDDGLVERLVENDVKFKQETPTISPEMKAIIIPSSISILTLFIIVRMIKTPGSKMSVGYTMDGTSVSFDDVAGQDEAIESFQEIVDYLKEPEKYMEIGAKLPKGILLEGKPGTGKTLLAKAVATEAGVPFFYTSGSSFIEMYAGKGASNVRKLFKEAEIVAPSIVFIDEIDGVGSKRNNGDSGSMMESNQTLNELLSAMDGFNSDSPIIVIGATNRPESLDPALLRTGRFDRRIIVDTPDLLGRKDILNVHLDKFKVSDDIDLDRIALITSGLVGADLANIINEAALDAVKGGRNEIQHQDILNAIENFMIGSEKKNSIIEDDEKEIIAFHEAGHAVVGSFLKGQSTIQKATIISRTSGSLGHVIQTPSVERKLMSKEDILAQLITILAGRATEEVVFGSITTGAYDDIQRATKIASDMVNLYGMGCIGTVAIKSHQGQYLNNGTFNNFSIGIQDKADHEIFVILKESYKTALEIVKEKIDTINLVGEYLLENETIYENEFVSLYGDIDEPDNTKAISNLIESIERETSFNAFGNRNRDRKNKKDYQKNNNKKIEKDDQEEKLKSENQQQKKFSHKKENKRNKDNKLNDKNEKVSVKPQNDNKHFEDLNNKRKDRKDRSIDNRASEDRNRRKKINAIEEKDQKVENIQPSYNTVKEKEEVHNEGELSLYEQIRLKKMKEEEELLELKEKQKEEELLELKEKQKEEELLELKEEEFPELKETSSTEKEVLMDSEVYEHYEYSDFEEEVYGEGEDLLGDDMGLSMDFGDEFEEEQDDELEMLQNLDIE